MVEIIEEYVEIKEDDVIPSEILIYLKFKIFSDLEHLNKTCSINNK